MVPSVTSTSSLAWATGVELLVYCGRKGSVRWYPVHRITWWIWQSLCPDLRVTVSGIGSDGESVGAAAEEGSSKEITSSTRMPFSGSRLADKSNAPFRCVW